MGTVRPGTRLRLPLLLASFALVAAYFTLQAQAAILQSAAAPSCESGSPVSIQGGPGMAGESDLLEIVTGWYRLDVGADQAVVVRSDCVKAVSALEGGQVPYDVKGAVWSWLRTDSFFFVPAYGVLLALIMVWASRQGWADPDAGSIAEGVEPPDNAGAPLLRAVGWVSSRWFVWPLLAAGVLADLFENWLIGRRVEAWWTILGRGESLVPGDLRITVLRAVGVVKWVALLVPLTVAVVCAVRQAWRAVVTIWRALPGLWLQLVIVVVFVAAVAAPDQSADAVRRLSAWQWLATSALVALFAIILLLTATGALKPRRSAPERARQAAVLAGAENTAVRASAAEAAATAGDPGGGMSDPVDNVDGTGARDGGGGPHPPPPPPPPPPAGQAGDTGSAPAQTAGAVTIAWWPGVVLVLIGALLVGASVITGWRGVVVPGVIVATTGLFSLVLDLLARHGGTARDVLDAADAANMSEAPLTHPDRLAAMRRVGICIAAAPVAAFGVAVIRATAGDAALLGGGDSWQRGWRLVIGICLTIGAGGLVLALRGLVDAVTASDRKVRFGITAALATALALGVFLHDPDINLTVADEVGALGLVTVFLSGLALLPVAAAWASYGLMAFAPMRPVVLPSAVRVLRVRSTPILGLLVVWALLVGFVQYPGYHDVRRLNVEKDGDRARTVEAVATDWWKRQVGASGSTPALLVAASGGGIRAAYWTAAVLDCVIERDGDEADPCGGTPSAARLAKRRSSILAMSGISGGSLGLAAYVTAIGDQWASNPTAPTPLDEGWYDRRLGGDYLAPTVAAWLFNDGLNALLRPDHGVDRAAVLERAWESDWDDGELKAPFLAGQRRSQPLLLLNGFSVEDGCRVNNSVFASDPGLDPSACDATASPNGAPLLRSTADLLDVLCPGEDVRVSTAALNSARFPYVTPSGRMRQCQTGSVDKDRVPDVEVVDGGYRETSGASTVVELWPRLEAAVGASRSAGACAKPIFVQIDNGYSADEVTTSGRGVVSQFTTPISALLASTRGQEQGARQESFELFQPAWFKITTSAHPGSSAPLGWLLSTDARLDLQDQLSRPATARAIVALRSELDSSSSPCT